jgi:hypothetical protein
MVPTLWGPLDKGDPRDWTLNVQIKHPHDDT